MRALLAGCMALVMATSAAAAGPGKPAAGWEPPSIPEVYEASEALGWPHPPEDDESVAITYRVNKLVTGRIRGEAESLVVCQFAVHSVERLYCGVVVERIGHRDLRYRLNVRVWPDGRYLISRQR